MKKRLLIIWSLIYVSVALILLFAWNFNKQVKIGLFELSLENRATSLQFVQSLDQSIELIQTPAQFGSYAQQGMDSLQREILREINSTFYIRLLSKEQALIDEYESWLNKDSASERTFRSQADLRDDLLVLRDKYEDQVSWFDESAKETERNLERQNLFFGGLFILVTFSFFVYLIKHHY